jgi:diguanylate cyclase (GGDEF)-like protein
VKHHRGQGQQAFYGELTGLSNRRLLMQQMTRTLTSAKKTGRRAAILCLMLDQSEQAVQHGQVVKDKCMKKVATMLTRRLRGMDTVVRTAEEEFTIVLGEVESAAAVRVVAKALLELFATPMEVDHSPPRKHRGRCVSGSWR